MSNYLYIVADSIPDINSKVKSSIIDICEEGNIDRVIRVMNTSFNELLNKLYAFTKDRVIEECTLDDVFTEFEKYDVYMLAPEGFSKTTVALINDYLHEYIVYSVLADWLSIIKKDEATVWGEKMAVCIEKMRSILNNRVGATRRKMSPF